MKVKPLRSRNSKAAKLYLLIALAYSLVGRTQPGIAQKTDFTRSSSDALPDAPLQTTSISGQEPEKGSASLSGVIVDQTGARAQSA